MPSLLSISRTLIIPNHFPDNTPKTQTHMSFFKSVFTDKLAAMRAAATRATLRMLHESNGFSLFLDEDAPNGKADSPANPKI